MRPVERQMAKNKKTNRSLAEDAKTKIGAAVLSAAVALNAAGMTDADLNFDGDAAQTMMPDTVIEEVVPMPADAGDIVPDADDEEEEKRTFSVGSVLTYVAGSVASLLAWLLKTPLTPVASSIIGWVILAAAILGAIGIGLKKAFPNLPLSKIVNKKTGAIVVCAIVLLIVSCEVVGFYWEDILRWVRIGAVVLGGVLVFVVIRKVKKAFRKPKKAAAAA